MEYECCEMGLGFCVLNPFGIYFIQSDYRIRKITGIALRERYKILY